MTEPAHGRYRVHQTCSCRLDARLHRPVVNRRVSDLIDRRSFSTQLRVPKPLATSNSTEHSDGHLKFLSSECRTGCANVTSSGIGVFNKTCIVCKIFDVPLPTGPREPSLGCRLVEPVVQFRYEPSLPLPAGSQRTPMLNCKFLATLHRPDIETLHSLVLRSFEIATRVLARTGTGCVYFIRISANRCSVDLPRCLNPGRG